MIIRRLALAALVAAIVPFGMLANAQAQSTTLNLDSAPYAPGFGFDRYVEGDFSITQAPFQFSPRLSGGSLVSSGEIGLYYVNGGGSAPLPSFTLARVDGLGFTIDSFSLTSFSADRFLPVVSAGVTITGSYGAFADRITAGSGITVTSAVFTFSIPERRGFLLDSITLGTANSNVLATPGPVLGAGIPAILGLASFAAWRRRRQLNAA